MRRKKKKFSEAAAHPVNVFQFFPNGQTCRFLHPHLWTIHHVCVHRTRVPLWHISPFPIVAHARLELSTSNSTAESRRKKNCHVGKASQGSSFCWSLWRWCLIYSLAKQVWLISWSQNVIWYVMQTERLSSMVFGNQVSLCKVSSVKRSFLWMCFSLFLWLLFIHKRLQHLLSLFLSLRLWISFPSAHMFSGADSTCCGAEVNLALLVKLFSGHY